MLAPSWRLGRFARRERGQTRRMKGLLAVLGAVLVAAFVVAAVAVADKGPERIALPDGYRPEGIAAGKGRSIYVGSIPTGQVLEIDTKTGAPRRSPCPPAKGTRRSGLKYDKQADRLFVSGGPTGKAFVYDAEQRRRACGVPAHRSRTAHVHQRRRAHPRRRVFHRLTAAGDLRREAGPVRRHADPLTGFPMTPGQNNLNGIEAARNGRILLAIQSSEGVLWRIDPRQGRTLPSTSTGPRSRTATDCC